MLFKVRALRDMGKIKRGDIVEVYGVVGAASSALFVVYDEAYGFFWGYPVSYFTKI